jgi:GNAT superfamily N-acetyltransferase
MMHGIRCLRARCWETIYVAGHSLEDGFDDEALHWVVCVAGEVIAAARLTIHSNLEHLPDSHLFRDFRSLQISYPLGYISRLVVHPEMRRLGIASQLDKLRIDEAYTRGCKTITVVWNPMSGERRRQQILSLNFKSFDGDKPLADGVFGTSYVYFRELTGVEGSTLGFG